MFFEAAQIFIFPKNHECLGFVYTESPRRKGRYSGGYSIGRSKQESVYVHVSYPEIELFHCTVSKFFIGKRYYVLFLIPVFTVEGTKLVQFT
jgi:hypothetical protein